MSTLRYKQGASVTEFLVAAPILALLMYAAIDLNQMVEFRQGLVVATRNTSFDRIGDVLHDLGSSQSLATQMAPFSTPETAEDKGALSSAKIQSDNGFSSSLGFHVDRAKDALPEGQRGSDSSFESKSEGVGTLSATANSGLDGLTKLINLNGAVGVWLLPPAKMRTVTATMTEAAGSSALRKSMSLMSKTAENVDGPVMAKTPGMSHMVYIRPETGYHPDGYVVQPLVGYLLGLQADYAKWGDTGRSVSLYGPVDNYNHACMMNFDGGGPECSDPNEYFQAIRLMGVFIRVFIMAAKATPVSPAAFVLDGGLSAVRGSVEVASSMAIDKVGSYVTERISDSAKKALVDVGLPSDMSDSAILFNPGFSESDIPLFDGWSRLSEF